MEGESGAGERSGPGPVESWRPAPDMPEKGDRELYPAIPDELVDTVRSYGEARTLAPGDVLFEQGETDAPFYFVEEGRVVFFDHNRGGPSTYFAEFGPRTFVGDVAMLSGEATIAECRAAEETRVVRLEPDELRDMVAENGAIGDLVLQAMVARRAWSRGHGYGDLRVIGSRWSSEAFRIRDFLSRNGVSFQWLDVERDAHARALLRGLGVSPAQTPVLVTPKGVLRNPDEDGVAEYLGLKATGVEGRIWDLLIVGAGPAGLAAAVYGSSEGLETLMLEASSPGGQAGTSARIENYLGFPTGLTGSELTERALLQARKFGTVISNPIEAEELMCGRIHRLRLSDGEVVHGRVVLVATGAEYRRLDHEGAQRFDGRGIYCGASHTEAANCRDECVVVVGGGNSAGQAAVHLSQYASCVTLVVRGESLEEGMSQYLVDRLERDPKIELLTGASLEAFEGDETLESVRVRSGPDGEVRDVETTALFVMIGAEPRTDWLRGCVALDERGFVVTGADAVEHPDFREHWTVPRRPHHLETSRPGVFAAGDVRRGSVKRVASAVGEGAMAVAFAHQVLEGR